MGKKKILLLCQLPPPIHGQTLMNSYVVGSRVLSTKYDVELLPIRFASSNADVGRFSPRKVLKTVVLSLRLFIKLLTNKIAFIYFTIAPTGKAFLRDCLFVGIAKLLRKTVVFHLHGKGIRDNSNAPGFGALYKWAFHRQYVIVLSEKLQHDVADLGLRRAPFVVPNGIPLLADDQEINSIFAERSEKTGPPTILFLSNMKISKGVLDLLQACASLKNEGVEFRAVFRGAWSNDNCRSVFYDFISKNDLENCVVYGGPAYGEEKVAAFGKADMFVFPSRNEAFPLVLLEAMQFGLPVISTSIGGIEDIVLSGENGIIIQSGDVDQLKGAMTELILDPQRRITFGQKGRDKYLREFTIERFEERLSKAFDEVSASL